MKKQRERKNRFVVVCFFVVLFQAADAQKIDFKPVGFSLNQACPVSSPYSQSFQKSGTAGLNFMKIENSKVPKTVLLPVNHILNADFYSQHLGYICQKEWQFEKFSRIPLRFRLGSLEQCNFLEGKR